MFKKVLIANRGEIAVRIIRSLRDLGIKSVAICSDVDKDCLHSRLADECICIGPRAAKDSYLNKVQIINAALVTGAEAIHPGFGFLSENAAFAKLCKSYGIEFIGPNSEIIGMMGDKEQARARMIEAGVPVVPGSKTIIDNVLDAKKIAKEISYPVIVKASAGGGGKGMRVANSENEIENAFTQASFEAKNAFGDGRLYMEKLIVNPRHIEVQILGDKFGNVIHLGERDCSLQINHQKVIEEAPASILTEKKRKEIHKIAVDAAKAVNYENAGTVEFLMDKNDAVYFMEMNTRIQVEHPITEMITGVDIVKEQINIACGNKLSYKQSDIVLKGHAIECRINAQDSETFVPSAGLINELNIPGGFGIRIDSLMYQGYKVLPFYDSMLAKIISFGKDRQEAINIMKRGLDELIIGGIKTNTDFNIKLMNDEGYVKGEFDTFYLEKIVNSTK